MREGTRQVLAEGLRGLQTKPRSGKTEELRNGEKLRINQSSKKESFQNVQVRLPWKILETVHVWSIREKRRRSFFVSCESEKERESPVWYFDGFFKFYIDRRLFGIAIFFFLFFFFLLVTSGSPFRRFSKMPFSPLCFIRRQKISYML